MLQLYADKYERSGLYFIVFTSLLLTQSMPPLKIQQVDMKIVLLGFVGFRLCHASLAAKALLQ